LRQLDAATVVEIRKIEIEERKSRGLPEREVKRWGLAARIVDALCASTSASM
jgi:hypothetical protein